MTLMQWHRRVGILACGALLLWSLSGAMHPLMSRYQPQPAVRTAPLVAPLAPDAPSLEEILARESVPALTEARLLQLPYGPAWRVETQAPKAAARYFLAANGEEVPDGELRHAEFLARHFLGDEDSAITVIERIEHFGEDYPYVNRLLPVHRAQFAREDGMQVFVDTRQALLATLVDTRKARMNWIFLTFHNWRFAEVKDGARAAVAALFLIAVLATPLLGYRLYRRRRSLVLTGARAWHRRLGLTVSVVVLLSSGSGLWHLMKGVQDRAGAPEGPRRAAQTLPADTLNTRRLRLDEPMQSLVLLSHEGRFWARVTTLAPKTDGTTHSHHDGNHGAEGHGGHGGGRSDAPAFEVRYLPLDDRQPATLDEERHAFALAGQLSERGAPEPTATPITMFGGEYGFINKFLPVMRFQTADTRLYVHAETRTLAAAVDPADYAEGWSFAQFHKWQALEPLLGRWPRDLLQIGFALAIALVSLLGLVLFARRAPVQARKN